MARSELRRLPSLLVVLAGAWLGSAPLTAAPAARPNIVFIAIDDLNDWIGALGGHPDVKTPHIDALARRGMLFTNAHCQVPVCMASRVSVMSGKLASTTGSYEFNAEFHENPALANDVPIPLHFKRHGYRTLGGGKLLHSGFQGRLAGTFDVALGKGNNPSPPALMNWRLRSWDYGAFPATDAEMGDYQLAQKAAEQLGRKHDQPFFLAVGFFRPHVPLHVPKKWFDLYDPAKLALPHAPADDRDDIPESVVTRTKAVAPPHAEVLAKNKWRDFVHAYLACISFVDHCVGLVADAVAQGPNRDNTLIVLWSDHGFHLGEKQHWAKRTLWNESTRVPLIFAGPGIKPGSRTDAAVGLLDLYPTLAEIAHLPARDDWDGRSLVPLIKDPAVRWDRAVVSTWMPNSHAVIDRRWRYIRYADGGEELYDRSVDPDELTNLARDPRHNETKTALSRWLPQKNAPMTRIPDRQPTKD